MDAEPVLPSAIIFSDGKLRDSETGKLTLTGIFHRICASGFPFTAPSFFATVFLTNLHGYVRDVPVTIKIETEHGETIGIASGNVTATSTVSRGDMAEISFPVPAMQFEAAGRFRAIVLIGGDRVGSRGFSVTSY